MVLFGVRCAQITPLTGGKKDNAPPKVIKSSPENATVNFSSSLIEIQFDEFVTLKDLQNQFVITPQIRENPEIETSGKKLKIKFKESLLPNTTYKLNFGNAICDIHEITPIQNFEYVFSTGASIDSLKLSGTVKHAFDKSPAEKFLIGLYDDADTDSVIYKQKPLYITKTDQNGNYTFNYLPNKKFKLIAINDVNKNLLYDGETEEIAFTNSTIQAGDSVSTILYSFKELPYKDYISKQISLEYGKALVVYNKPKPSFKNIEGKGISSYQLNNRKDSLTIFYDQLFDSLKAYINYNDGKRDTLEIKIPTKAVFEKQLKNGFIKYIINSNIYSGQLAFFEDPTFDVNFPVTALNQLKEHTMVYERGTDTLISKKDYELVSRSENSFYIKSKFKAETNYRIIFNKGALNNAYGRINDSIAFNFKLSAEEDYGQLTLKLLFPNKKNYVVQLLNEKQQAVKTSLVEQSIASSAEKTIHFKNLPPAKYFIKVIEDENKNGVFDTGNYLLHQQAETIFINLTPIKLLSGWEIDNEWKVN